ncbi:virulence factor Mce family protein [Mycolicibacterium conceptionense]|uniref:Virulence factor Mce family protein n=1 Tax=Mycolicibacterium conceptionense TaxID=451644 RepID=A0A0U1DIK9_9MYCO|nr:virulence factor Mce family protein [Mycolicibacterium conceptionense]
MTGLKFGVFAVISALLTGFLLMVFGDYRSGDGRSYSAIFTSASRLEVGDSVRAAGIRVGTVTEVTMRPDYTVFVAFDADPAVGLSTATKAVVRYLNLVGDRYLELVDGPGSTKLLAPGSQIPVERTMPALNLDLLLGGLKPVVEGLNPRDINTLTASLLQILQGQGGTLNSLLSHTSSFTNALADNDAAIQGVIDNLNTTLQVLSRDGDKFSGAIDQLEQLISGLAGDRDPIGEAITALDQGTASMADLLGGARPPLAAAVDQVKHLAPLLDQDKGQIDLALQNAPENYRKLARLGAYGSFINYYICGISFRASDLQGRTAVYPWIKQEGGRCSEPDAQIP